MCRINKYGDLIWSRVYFDDFSADNDGNDGQISSLDISSDGNIILVGQKSISNFESSAFIMKVDSEGNELFSSNDIPLIESIKKTSDDQLIGLSSTGPGFKILKVSEDFSSIIFENTISGDLFSYPVSAISECLDGGFVVVCEIDINNNGEISGKPFLIKINVDGSEVWRKELSYNYPINTISSQGVGVSQSEDNNIFVCKRNTVEFFGGQFEGHIELTKLNSSGD